jgi:phage-Barnase-EndoU-ColicinE5/D-RelE like nuclease3
MNQILITLIKDFFKLPKGVFISEPNQKIKILEFESRPVYISRKSLKHFVESRKDNLSNLEEEKQLFLILELINDLPNVILNSDKFLNNKKKRKNSFLYIKKIDSAKTPRGVVVEKIENHFEIVSIHFIKEKDYFKYLQK